MKVNDTLYGWRVYDVTEIGAIGAVMNLLEHEKCGAKLCYLDREDESRTFAITFGTPPKDDTGVFHILEHSVLCGSDKFPTKEPFTELLKSSLYTFLNAMTYSDKTSYPVASRNDKDFYNLVNVYMDAVLHPLAASEERIFSQEGWRYEPTEDGFGYNGVVYSEMRGVYSSADSIAAYHNARLLFPNGTYSYDSGGHPDHIPELSYEGFVRAHREHYHPSGAYLFLDGKPKLDEILPLLDSYLTEYERQKTDYTIERGGDIITEPLYEKFSIDESDTTENKTRVYLTYVSGEYNDTLKQSALTVLTDALADSNEAPLKKAILASELCDNVYIYNSPGCKWSTFNIEFRGVPDGKEKELIAHFDKCTEELIESGIDRSLLYASKDRIEFKTREADFGSSPKGIVYLSAVNDVWMYGMHPARVLDHDILFEELDRALASDYPERTLRDVLSSKRATLILTPDKTLDQKEAEKLEQSLKERLAPLSESELEALRARAEEFSAWQSTPDTEEDLAKIPRLTIADLDTAPPEVPTIIDKCDGYTIINYPINTSGITYVDMYFDASDIEAEDLPLLAFMGSLYSNLATERGSANDFRRRAKSTVGSIGLVHNVTKCKDEPKLYMLLSYSCLDARRDEALDLAMEYLYEAILDNKPAIRRLLSQYTDVYSDAIVESGHSFALRRSSARHSRVEALREYTSGYELYRWFKNTKDARDEELDALISKMESFREKFFSRNRLTLSVTGECDRAYFERCVSGLNEGKPVGVSNIQPFSKKNEGIAVPAKVSYAAAAGNLFDVTDERHSGAWTTMQTILDFETLWEEVRVKGGAYGTGFVSRANSGTTAFYSYRDPNPKGALDAYKKSPELLRSMLESDRDLTGFIIGSVGAQDPVSTPKTRGRSATALYLAGLAYADTVRAREECIGTTPEGLARLSYLLDRIIEKSTYTVVGPKEKLAELALDEIYEL